MSKPKGTKYSEASLDNIRRIAAEKTQLFIKSYEENPKLCKCCDKPLPYDKRRNNFCDHSCSAHYTNAHRGPVTEETKKAISDGMKNSPAVAEANKNRINNTPTFTKICHNQKCGKEFIVSGESRKHKEYCNNDCYLTDENKRPGGQGGYRVGSGHGKQGWYKNYWCDSSYELAFVVYNLDHNIQFERNKEGFEYIFNGGHHRFFPDFIMDGKYIEIKGYFNEQQWAKINQFPHSIEVIDKEKIKPYIKYAVETYGRDYIELYEGNPHHQKNNICQCCGDPCKKIFCSQSCAGKFRAEEKKRGREKDT